MTKSGIAALDRKSKEQIALDDRRSRDRNERNRLNSEEARHAQSLNMEEKVHAGNTIKGVLDSVVKGIGTVAKFGKGSGQGNSKSKNDPSIYKKYPIDLDKWTSVAQYHKLGYSNFGKVYGYGVNTTGVKSIPGICVIRYHSCIGPQRNDISESTIATNPINQILMRSKEQVLKLNSRSSVNWEAGDLGFNLLVTNSIITQIEEFKRAIKIAYSYNPYNAYFVKSMLMALGFNPDDMLDNIASAKRYLDLVVARFNSACVAPKSLTLYERSLFLSSNVIADSVSANAQHYVYVSGGWYTLSSDATYVGYNKTQVIPTTANLLTVYGAYTRISDMITSITENPDYIEMYADLRAAFGSDLIKLESVSSGTPISPICNQSVLAQIHNLKVGMKIDANAFVVNHAAAGSGTWDIRQTTNGYIYQGIDATLTTRLRHLTCATIMEDTTKADAMINVCSEFNSINADRIILDDPFKDIMTSDDVLDNTRGIAVGEYSAHATTGGYAIDFYPTSCGTELFEQMIFCTLVEASSTDPKLYRDFTCSVNIYDTVTPALIIYATASVFSCAPMMTAVTYASGYGIGTTNTFADLNHAFSVANQVVYDLNTACVLSEFYLDASTFKKSY